jgi:hypothetical protein
MSRLACALLLCFAACTSGTETGPATLSGTTPPVMSASSKPFTGADGDGNMVLGWTIELFANGPGSDCLDDDNDLRGSIGIFTSQAAGSAPQAILQIGGISVVTASPPSVVNYAAANVGLKGVSGIQGLISITEFHLTADAKTADRISGMINIGGTDTGTGADVNLVGEFIAPICVEK